MPSSALPSPHTAARSALQGPVYLRSSSNPLRQNGKTADQRPLLKSSCGKKAKKRARR